jgi:hypothetical protein
VDVGNSTKCSVGGLESGVAYYFAVTAYDTGGLESYYSDEVSYSASNSKPSTETSNGGSAGGCFIHASASDRSPINYSIILILSVTIGVIAKRCKVTSKPN